MSSKLLIENTNSLKNQEYHVASFVANAMNGNVQQVKQSINDIDGTEIHGVSPTGKIVFTIEDSSHRAIGNKIDLLKNHEGLLSLLPVYHQL